MGNAHHRLSIEDQGLYMKRTHGVVVDESMQFHTTYVANDSNKQPVTNKDGLQSDQSQVLTPLALRRQRSAEMQANRPVPSKKSVLLARETWAFLSANRDGLGTDLFIRMFESYPDLKSAFGPFKHLNHHDASYEEVLRAHGVRVVNIVELVLNLWQNEEEVIQNLHELGRRHLTFSAKVEYVDIVSQMFLFAIESALKDKWNNSTEHAWGEIIRYITYIMKETMTL